MGHQSLFGIKIIQIFTKCKERGADISLIMESSVSIKPCLSGTRGCSPSPSAGSASIDQALYSFSSLVMKVLVRHMNSAVIYVKGIKSWWGRFSLSRVTKNLAVCLGHDSESKFCFVREVAIEAGQSGHGDRVLTRPLSG